MGKNSTKDCNLDIYLSPVAKEAKPNIKGYNMNGIMKKLIDQESKSTKQNK